VTDFFLQPHLKHVSIIRENLEIYGPLGTRRFVRTTLELSRSMVTYDYEVHEIIPVEEQFNQELQVNCAQFSRF